MGIDLKQPGNWVGEVLKTITSDHLRKVTFESCNEDYCSAFVLKNIASSNPLAWKGLDLIFQERFERWTEKSGGLEISFSLPKKYSDAPDIGEFLRDCRDVGVAVEFECKKYDNNSL